MVFKFDETTAGRQSMILDIGPKEESYLRLNSSMSIDELTFHVEGDWLVKTDVTNVEKTKLFSVQGLWVNWWFIFKAYLNHDLNQIVFDRGLSSKQYQIDFLNKMVQTSKFSEDWDAYLVWRYLRSAREGDRDTLAFDLYQSVWEKPIDNLISKTNCTSQEFLTGTCAVKTSIEWCEYLTTPFTKLINLYESVVTGMSNGLFQVFKKRTDIDISPETIRTGIKLYFPSLKNIDYHIFHSDEELVVTLPSFRTKSLQDITSILVGKQNTTNEWSDIIKAISHDAQNLAENLIENWLQLGKLTRFSKTFDGQSVRSIQVHRNTSLTNEPIFKIRSNEHHRSFKLVLKKSANGIVDASIHFLDGRFCGLHDIRRKLEGITKLWDNGELVVLKTSRNLLVKIEDLKQLTVTFNNEVMHTMHDDVRDSLKKDYGLVYDDISIDRGRLLEMSFYLDETLSGKVVGGLVEKRRWKKGKCSEVLYL